MAKDPEKKKEYVYPDGGWGWVVVLGCILNGLTSIPIIQNFGLIYKQRLEDLQFSSTDITTIVSMNSSLGQILGVFQGPLLKKFGYRKMAVFGVGAFTLGTFLTGLSQSFTHFIITYGIITSIGFTYSLTSFSFAMSSYFRKKRSRASGLSMGFTGLGPVVLPQFVTFTLPMYGVMGTGFLLAALNANGFVGACLLRPIKWYRKEKKENIENLEKVPAEDASDPVPPIDAEPFFGGSCFDLSRRMSSSISNNSHVLQLVRSISENEDKSSVDRRVNQIIHGSAVRVVSEEEKLLKPTMSDRKLIQSQDDIDRAMKSTLQLTEKPFATLASTETLEGSASIVHDSHTEALFLPAVKVNDAVTSANLDLNAKPDTKKGWLRRLGSFISQQFDLDLLQDPVYVSITLGLSIAVIGELIFSILTPFILYELGLDLQMTASFMSISAITDIVSRFVSPYIGEWVKLNSRVMYLIALFFLLVSRASLFFVSGTIGFAFVAAFVGFAKGVRTIFWMQVLPDYVHPEKLGSAMSIQNLINGIFIFFAGPLSGLIVEINNSYLNIIYVSNALTGMTILLWTAEYLVTKFRQRRKK